MDDKFQNLENSSTKKDANNSKKPPLKFVNSLGEIIPSEEINQAMMLMLQKGANGYDQIDHPRDLREFEDRIGKYLDLLYERTFGIIGYLDVDERTTVDKDLSLDNLIEIGIKIARKYKDRPFIISQQINGYDFLKKALIRGYPFADHIQDLFGIPMDIHPISKPHKEIIGFQSAAQVLWFLKKERINGPKAMREAIFETKFLRDILKIRNNHNLRVVENHIREVNPYRKGKKQSNQTGSELVLIPGVFLENPFRINFMTLQYTVSLLSRILSGFGLTEEAIIESEIIKS